MDIRTIYVGDNEENAVSSLGLLKIIQQVQSAIDQHQPICFVGTNSGRFFCSGFDINELKELPLTEVRQHFEHFLTLTRLVFTAPVPVFCQASGHAVGIGATLCLAADLTGMDSHAKFRFPEAMLGITLFSDVVNLLRYRLTAAKQVERFLMQAKAFTASEAHQLGVIDMLLESKSAVLPMEDYCEHFFNSVYGEMKQLCRSDIFQTAISEQVSFFMKNWEKRTKED